MTDTPWAGVLDFPERDFAQLMGFVAAERRRGEVYPRADEVFATFRLTEYDEAKVVLLGQDPYPNPGHANGLSFSVHRNVLPLPTSLVNIHHAMSYDRLAVPEHGDLTAWGKQGVLLLNTALTVRRNVAGSHLREWSSFTQAVIRRLSDREEPLVFLLWGAKAQWWQQLIDTDRHKIVTAPHPAARGSDQTRFRESKSFSKVNAMLDELGTGRIDWEIRD